MKADIVSVGDVFVAGIAVALGRVGNKTGVSQLFILAKAVTAVADDTANFPVGI